MVPEFLTLMNVRDMNLDYRCIKRAQRVEDRDRGVGERGRVDGDATGGVPRLVNPVDDLVLVVALVEAEVERQLPGQGAAVALDIGQGLVAVDVGLAPAEQVEVGAVQHINEAAHRDVSSLRIVAPRAFSNRGGSEKISSS